MRTGQVRGRRVIKLTYSRVWQRALHDAETEQIRGRLCRVRSLIPPSTQQNEKFHSLLAYLCTYACTLMADDTRECGSECDVKRLIADRSSAYNFTLLFVMWQTQLSLRLCPPSLISRCNYVTIRVFARKISAVCSSPIGYAVLLWCLRRLHHKKRLKIKDPSTMPVATPNFLSFYRY